MIRNGLRVRAKSTADAGALEASDSSPIDAALIRQLAELVSESDLAEIEIEKGDLRIRLTRHHRSKAGPVVAQAAMRPATQLVQAAPVQAVPVPASAEEDPANLVKSPMVGTVYRRQNPESKPFVEIGTTVKAGERVLLVEAMKTFNDIVAHKSGTISAILVEDGQPVEFGEPLIVIA